MAASPCDTPSKKPRIDSDDSQETGTDSPNSSKSSDESTGSVTEKLPRDVSRWKEEHIQSLSISTEYEENMTPFQLISTFHAEDNPHLKQAMSDLIPAVEYFFTGEFCGFHRFLNTDFDSLLITAAQELRDQEMYNSKLFLRTWQRISGKTSNSDELQKWCQRFESNGEKFGETLYYMILRKNICERADRKSAAHPLCEFDFQCLFDVFASMFGLRSFTLSEPFMRSSKMQISGVNVYGKADILYCKDMKDVPYNSVWEDLCRIVAVCEVPSWRNHSNNKDDQGVFRRVGYMLKIVIPSIEVQTVKVKKYFSWTEAKPCRKTRSTDSEVSSTKSPKLPNHVSMELLGQHGGELLLYYPQSFRYTTSPIQDSILGMIVQETKVTFTALKMTQDEYDALCAGKLKSISPKLIVTRPYDFMKKEDRIHLIKPLLALAVIQNS